MNRRRTSWPRRYLTKRRVVMCENCPGHDPNCPCYRSRLPWLCLHGIHHRGEVKTEFVGNTMGRIWESRKCKWCGDVKSIPRGTWSQA